MPSGTSATTATTATTAPTADRAQPTTSGQAQPATPGQAPPTTPAKRPAPLAPTLFLALVAVCSAVTAANIYLAAPLLPLIARDFGSTPSAVAWIASVAQFGYAIGLLLFAPLGDTVNRRRLVTGLTVVTTAALAASAAAGGSATLAVAVFVASAATVIPQLLVPLVAERAPAARRARHVAAVISGLFAGIVAARVVGGLAGQAFGWRAVFLGAGGLTLVLGLATALVLPSERRPRAGHLLSGIPALPGLVRRSPDLWRACVRQAGMFGAWSALWTSLALLLTGPSYGLSIATAGLFGLFGLTASVVAPLAGGLVDRFGAARVVGSAYLLAAVSLPLFWLGGQVMWAVFVAAIAVHAALVASHVANQTLALTTTSTPATANTAYVVSGFAGGAIASALAGTAYSHWGWGGVCAVAGVWLLLGWTTTSVRR
ncbi:MFS transporter [Streptomyces spinoverrucosus]|uniref:MFS transporter n=1 Tax=Streptomyces spinoverrucosus TaxID=284043 RepID=UPI0018C36349|nr:MFS transporter [Streptomyces spinoverrucosus]MBG0854033.1 MFS transporter [Streptomyces spinoverrucosus]